MFYSRSLLLCVASSIFFRSAFAAKCSGVIGIVASAVSPLPEAQSFCSAIFPQGAPTQTLAPSTVVVSTTVTAGVQAKPVTSAVTVSVTTSTQFVATDTTFVTGPSATVS